MRRTTAARLGLAAVVAAVVARSMAPHVRAVRALPQELRSPMLYLALDVTSRRGLRLMRMLPAWLQEWLLVRRINKVKRDE